MSININIYHQNVDNLLQFPPKKKFEMPQTSESTNTIYFVKSVNNVMRMWWFGLFDIVALLELMDGKIGSGFGI